jgi:hypothetical protein
MTESTRVGIDENGLGPRLGPLVVTAVTARVTDEGANLLAKRPRGGLATRLGDSKRLVSFDDSALGEAWARAMAERSPSPAPHSTPEQVVRALALEDDAALRALCPSHHAEQCWRTEGEALAAEAALLAEVTRDLARLAARGVTVQGARVAIVCASIWSPGCNEPPVTLRGSRVAGPLIPESATISYSPTRTAVVSNDSARDPVRPPSDV